MARRARGAQVIHIYKISLLLNLFYWKKNPPTPCAPRSLPILKVRLRSNPEEYSPVDIWQPSQFSKNFIYFSRFSYRALLAFSFSVFDYFAPPFTPDVLRLWCDSEKSSSWYLFALSVFLNSLFSFFAWATVEWASGSDECVTTWLATYASATVATQFGFWSNVSIMWSVSQSEAESAAISWFHWRHYKDGEYQFKRTCT